MHGQQYVKKENVVFYTLRNVKGKVFPVHTMKTYRWSGDTAPRIPYLGTRWR